MKNSLAGVSPVFPKGAFILPLTLMLVVLAGGCGKDNEKGGVSVSTDSDTPECEAYGFPCTWDEVSPEIKERTLDLGQVAGLYGTNASLVEIAAFLGDQQEVEDVEVIGTGVRYRLRGGRPAWVYPGDELGHHGPGLATHSSQDQPVNSPDAASGIEFAQLSWSHVATWLTPSSAMADSPDGNNHGVAAEVAGKGKKALVLSPFEWEWYEKEIPWKGQAMADRATHIRDYKPENGGDVTFHADLYETEDNPQGAYPTLSGQVEFADFLNWKDYSLIVLATHGTEHRCARKAPVGGARSEPDPVPDPSEDERDPSNYCPLVWAGRAKQSAYGAYSGVEIVSFVRMEYFEHPGLSPTEAQACAAALAAWKQAKKNDPNFSDPEPTTPGGKPCRRSVEGTKDLVALWTPFFKQAYPQGLENVILFFASCRSGINNILLDHFAQPGNRKVAVMGFDNTVDAEDGFMVAYRMIELVDEGLENQKIIDELKKLDRTRTKHFVGRALDLGDEPLPAKPAELLDTSEDLTHGRDIVMLVNSSGMELENGGSVRVEVSGSDDEPDRLSIHPQIIGLEDDLARELELAVRVVDEPLPDERYRPTRRVEEWVNRHPQSVSLGRKHEEGEMVDLEISVDFPGGYDSRWTYRDISLTAAKCSWSVSVSGHSPATGYFEGTTGSVTFDNSSRPPLSIDAYPGEGEPDHPGPQPPWMVIRLQDMDLSKLRDPSVVSEIHFAIPEMQSGRTGSFERVWGTMIAGGVSYDGNADYLRRDLIGLPEGSGIGHLLTSNVNLTRNDDERIEGRFDARFLNSRVFLQLGPYQQHPLGVGIHPIPDAQVEARGEFSILKDGGCRAKFRPKRIKPDG